MASLDYTPSINGVAYDPAPNGGSVDELTLYDNPDRTGTPVTTVGPAVVISPGVYEFTVPDTLIGRFWLTVSWKKDAASDPFLDSTGRIDLPVRYDLICSPEDVAVRLGVQLPLTGAQRERIVAEIDAMQGDVAAYLRRPITFPQQVTLTGQFPILNLDLTDWKAWPDARAQIDDRITILSTTAELDANSQPTGSYTVVFLVGIDGRAIEPIRNYVTVAAAESLRLDPSSDMGKRQITSVSAEGQSISYERKLRPYKGQSTAAGTLPTLESLRAYRRLSVRESTRVPGESAPWPYQGFRRY